MILYLFEDACFTCHCYRAPQLFCSNSLKNYFACSSLSQGMGRVETRKTYLPFQQRYLAAIKRGGFNQNLKDLIALLNFFVYMNIFFLILNTLIIPFIFILFRVNTIETAKLEDHMEGQNNDTANGYTRPTLSVSEENKNGNNKPKGLSNGLRKTAKKYPDYIQIAMPAESRNKFPLEWWKTGIAFVYALFNLILTTVMITVVHERVPPKERSPPLPDKFFDYIDRVTWAFSVSEINGMILVGLWIFQWLFLRYK